MAELKDEMSKGAISAQDVAQAFQDATSDGGKFNGAMESQSKTMAGQWSTVMDNFKQFSGEIIKPLFDYISNTLLPAVSNFIGWLTLKDENGIANWQKILDFIKNIGIVIVPVIAAFGALKLILDIASVIKAVSTAWAILNTVMNANVFAIIVVAIAALVALFIYLWTTNEGFRNAVTAIWNKIVQMFKDSAKWIVDTWNAVITWFKELPGKFKAVVDGIVKWFQELPGKIWTWLVETVNKVVTWLVDLQNKINTGVSQIINGVVKWFSELPSKIWTWLTQTISKIGQWLSDMQSKMNSGISELVSKVVKWFQELPGKLYNVGVDIVKGIWNGITSMVSWLAEKVSNWASGILNNIKSAMGIKSPSKVTAGFGEYLAQGLGVGFGREINSVYKQMQNSINLENDKLETSLQTGSVYQNVMNTTPVNVNGTYTSNLMLDGNLLAVSLQNINQRRELQYGY